MINKEQKIESIDIKKDIIKSKGIAYYRLDDGLFNFLTKCNEKENIIGFEWDGSRNFGIVLGENQT